MADFRFELNPPGIGELLKSAEVAADLERRAHAVAAAAGPGHRVESSVTGKRARSAVITDTIEAMVEEATERNLSRSFDAARG